MRRAPIALALLALVAVGLLVSRGGEEDGYRVAAVFDTAKGMVPGQQVKIAGAVVGRIDRIDLAPGPKARMVLDVERRYGPFRADASCSIRPEGLISENFVECRPGTAARDLAADASGVPVVPLERTTVPVSLQDVIDVFSLPTAQRLGVFITELGIAGAGRGEDLNALLRRANPALASSRRVLDILAAQRRQIAAAVTQTDRVLARLGRQDEDVRGFVTHAADVAETTAGRRTQLASTVERLPAMLRAVRPGLRALDATAQDATPLLRSVRAAAPGLDELTRTLPAFSNAGRPALRSLTAVTRTARPAIRRATPVVAQLRRAASDLGVLAPDVDRLLVSLRDSGGIEGAMRLTYTLAILASSYDETSHLINFVANLAPNCIVAEQAGRDEPGCSRMWRAPGNGTVPINQPRCGPQQPQNLWRNYRCPISAPPVGTFPRDARPKASRPAPRKPTAPGGKPSPAAKDPVPARPAIPGLPVDVPKLLEGLLGKRGEDAPGDENDETTALLDFLLK